MVEPKELMLGNILQLINGEIVTVLGFDSTEIKFHGKKFGSLSKGHFNPVPINNDWLERFGFKKTSGSIWFLDLGYIDFYWDSETGLDFSYEGANIGFPINCKYIHQLQNLYFALTGEELTIKQ